MAAKKRCRSLGGVVYDLIPTDRQPPCRRGRVAGPPKSVRPPPPKSVRPPPTRSGTAWGNSANQGRKRGTIVVNDHRVLERQERDRAFEASHPKRGAKKPKPRDLPPTYPPSSARVGDIVSVVSEGETIATLGTSVFSYGKIEALPGPGKYGTVSTEPAVTFTTGALQGMTRHVRWDRIYPGMISNDVVWKKWSSPK
jgi:hypothetical protein